MTQEACLKCSAGLACASGMSGYYFKCVGCGDYHVQLSSGETLKISSKRTLGCTLGYASSMNNLVNRCCGACHHGRMAEHDTRSVP